MRPFSRPHGSSKRPELSAWLELALSLRGLRAPTARALAVAPRLRLRGTSARRAGSRGVARARSVLEAGEASVGALFTAVVRSESCPSGVVPSRVRQQAPACPPRPFLVRTWGFYGCGEGDGDRVGDWSAAAGPCGAFHASNGRSGWLQSSLVAGRVLELCIARNSSNWDVNVEPGTQAPAVGIFFVGKT